ncbi:hypothetical protein Tco_0410627 [Tanacetum coccineum]
MGGRILSDAEVQEKASNETEPVIQDVTPTEVIQDQESSEKGSAEVSTAGAKKGTASEEVPIVSTAEVNLSTAGGTVTYSRRSEEQRKRKDKKTIVTEPSPKKSKGHRLQEMKKLLDNGMKKKTRAMSWAKTSKKKDWMIFSHKESYSIKMKPKTIMPLFEKYGILITIKQLDSEYGSEIMKSPEKMKSAEKIKEEYVATQKEMKEVSKGSGAKRKKYIPRKSIRKRQKKEEDAEREELKGFLDIIPRERCPIEVNSLSTKFPIVDWKTYILIDRIVEECTDKSKERYSTSRPKGMILMLCEIYIPLFKPDERTTYAGQREIPLNQGYDFPRVENEIGS